MKNAMTNQAFKFLKDKAATMSKTNKLHYDKFEMQEYLKTDTLTKNEKLLLLKLRLRMIQVGKNYGRKDICPACKDPEEIDQQSHLLACTELINLCPAIAANDVNYEGIFQSNVINLKKLVKLFKMAMTTRDELIDKQNPN